LDESLSSRRRSVELFLASLLQQLDQPWTLDSMAEQCGLGRTRFTHYCCELTNRSPLEYLNNCRIEQACRLLENDSKQSVTDIAFSCGFTSSQYFATVFRRFTETSPQAYRKAKGWGLPKQARPKHAFLR
jgi:AraC-like DNA-binding protein